MNDPPDLGSPRFLSHSLAQDDIQTLFYLSVSDPLMYTGSLVLSCMLGSHIYEGFPGSSDSKASACNAGDLGSIPRLGRSSGEGNGNPLQYSYLENSMDGGAW